MSYLKFWNAHFRKSSSRLRRGLGLKPMINPSSLCRYISISRTIADQKEHIQRCISLLERT